jgi:hypothetical protein
MGDPSDKPERIVEVLRELVALTSGRPAPKSDRESTKTADAEEVRDRDVFQGTEQVSD